MEEIDLTRRNVSLAPVSRPLNNISTWLDMRADKANEYQRNKNLLAITRNHKEDRVPKRVQALAITKWNV